MVKSNERIYPAHQRVIPALAIGQSISQGRLGAATFLTGDFHGHRHNGYHDSNQERWKMDGLNILMLICLIIVGAILAIVNYREVTKK